MAAKHNLPKSLSRRTVNRSVKARLALSDNPGQGTRSIFVAGKEMPQVETKGISVERKVDGRKMIALSPPSVWPALNFT